MARQLTEMRYRRILHLLTKKGGATVVALAKELEVSAETIRRDLVVLEEEKALRRVYGGALPLGEDLQPLHQRLETNVDGKDRIGRAVADMVAPGQWVFFCGGSTPVPAARWLARRPRIRAMTHMPIIAEILAEPTVHDVHLTGGCYDPKHKVLLGPDVENAFRDRVFDLAIIGIHRLDPAFGTGDVLDPMYRLKRAVMAHSRRCIWLCSSCALEGPWHFRTARFAEMETLIVDQEPPAEISDAVAKANTTMIVASEAAAVEPSESPIALAR